MAAAKTEHEIVTLERRYWQALKDKDLDTALSLTADPCIVVGAQGVGRIDKTTFASRMQDPSWQILDFAIDDDVEVQVSGDTAMLAYVVHEDMSVEGKTFSFDAADASTWIRRDGQWVCVLHTESVMRDPLVDDRARE
jgi:ketosteroid isomerase-like protein